MAQRQPASPDAIHVAILGAGVQGGMLTYHLLTIPEVRIRAVVDIYDFNRQRLERLLQREGHEVRGYRDYREMLAAERDLDAVIIATPDFVHAEQTIACLRADLHVYCEAEMAHTIDAAREMVRVERETGKLLQIGRHCRSNPYYRLHPFIIQEARLLGDITHSRAQWNQVRPIDVGYLRRFALDEATLNAFGYGSMNELRNWRWFRRYCAGPMADAGAHQLDVCNWVLDAHPRSIFAIGSSERAAAKPEKEDVGFVPENEDNILAIYEWDTPGGTVRGFHQVLLTSSHRGVWQSLVGMNGLLGLAGRDAEHGMQRSNIRFESRGQYVADGPEGHLRLHVDTLEVDKTLERAKASHVDLEQHFDALPTPPWGTTFQGDALERQYRQRDRVSGELHPTKEESEQLVRMRFGFPLQNFVDAIRGRAERHCDGATAFASTVAAMRAHDAMRSGEPYVFKGGEFEA